MNISLILPHNKQWIDFSQLKNEERLYFLAGPIRGAKDWHAEAIRIISKKDPGAYIVCPSRYNVNHELYKFSFEYTQSVEDFPNQTLWERHFLAQASYYGCVVFWLPEEDKNNPRKKEKGPYAQDTYGELGRWSLISAHQLYPINFRYDNHINLVIGAEAGFPGLSVIEKNYAADHNLEYPYSLVDSLENTVARAVKLAKKTRPKSLFNSENS